MQPFIPESSAQETSFVTNAQTLTPESHVQDSVPESVLDYSSVKWIFEDIMGLVEERIEQTPQGGISELDRTITIETSQDEETDEQFAQSQSGETDNQFFQDESTEHLSKDDTVSKNDTEVSVFPTGENTEDNPFIPNSSSNPEVNPSSLLDLDNKITEEGGNIFSKYTLVGNVSDSPKGSVDANTETSDDSEFLDVDSIDINASQIILKNNPRSLALTPGVFIRILKTVSNIKNY